jgi:hypothetical protein
MLGDSGGDHARADPFGRLAREIQGKMFNPLQSPSIAANPG